MPPEQPSSFPTPQVPPKKSATLFGHDLVWVFLIALVILGGGTYFITARSGSRQTVQAPPPLPTFTQNAGGLTTYTNNQFKFSIRYPSTLMATTSLAEAWPAPSGGSGIEITSSVIGEGQGHFTAAATNDPIAVSTCLIAPTPSEDSVTNVATTTIGGVPFLSYTRGDAAMGHDTGWQEYHAVRNGVCYTLVNTLETYDENRLSTSDAAQEEKNIVQVHADIDPILQTFQFSGPVLTGPPDSCTLTTDKPAYAFGDTVTLSWKAGNPSDIAEWKPMLNPAADMAPPAGAPALDGSGTTIANVVGSPVMTLYVGGLGGGATCSVTVPTTPSSAHATLHMNPTTVEKYVGSVITHFTGTVDRPELLHGSFLLTGVDDSYTGPTDEASILGVLNAHPGAYLTFRDPVFFTQTGSDGLEYGKSWETTISNAPAATYLVFAYPNDPTIKGIVAPLVSAKWTVFTASGMTSYKDPYFGFLFYYPYQWTVKQVAVQDSHRYNDGTVSKELDVSDGTRTITIEEFTSDAKDITDATGPNAVHYRFDTTRHQWMSSNTNNIEVPADISANTMAELHMLFGAKADNGNTIIPLSAKNFLIVTSLNPTVYNQNPLVRTIVALDASEGLLSSTTEQQTTVDAEAAAYAQ